MTASSLSCRTRALCIAGMHRSGTSLVARLLNFAGVHLGPESELMAATAANPDGYWENIEFVKLNDQILAELGSRWDVPRPLPEGWEADERMHPLRSRAQDLIERFTGHEPWGWKDPRNSLTVPFWRQMIPGLKVVVCVRNPLEVAWSLREREWASEAFGLNLWLTYYQRLLPAVGPADRVVTHYEAFFYDTGAELRRVLDSLGIPASERAIEDACSMISASLRHNRATTQDLVDAGIGADIVECYEAMCAEAGPVCRLAVRAAQRERERAGRSARVRWRSGWGTLAAPGRVWSWIAPHGSRREGWVLSGMRRLRVWRQAGLVALVRKGIRRARGVR